MNGNGTVGTKDVTEGNFGELGLGVLVKNYWRVEDRCLLQLVEGIGIVGWDKTCDRGTLVHWKSVAHLSILSKKNLCGRISISVVAQIQTRAIDGLSNLL